MAERLTGLPERLRELALGQDDPDARDEDRLMWQAADMLDQLAADKKRQAEALDRMQRQRRHEKNDARKHRKEVDRDTKALVAQRDEAVRRLAEREKEESADG